MTYTTPDTLSATAKSQVEAGVALASVLFSSTERLAHLALERGREGFATTTALAHKALEVKTPQEAAALQSHLGQPTLEHLSDYSRSVLEVATSTQADLVSLFEKQIAEFNLNVATAIDSAAKNAPSGSEPAFAAVKSALAATNLGIESASKALRTLTETTLGQIGKASDAAVKAGASATRAAKKAA